MAAYAVPPTPTRLSRRRRLELTLIGECHGADSWLDVRHERGVAVTESLVGYLRSMFDDYWTIVLQLAMSAGTVDRALISPDCDGTALEPRSYRPSDRRESSSCDRGRNLSEPKGRSKLFF